MLFTEYSFIAILALLVPANFVIRKFPVAQKAFLLCFQPGVLCDFWAERPVALLDHRLRQLLAHVGDRQSGSGRDQEAAVEPNRCHHRPWRAGAVQICRLHRNADPSSALRNGHVDALPWDPLWRPIALSFYVFHMVSYAINIRSGKYKPAGGGSPARLSAAISSFRNWRRRGSRRITIFAAGCMTTAPAFCSKSVPIEPQLFIDPYSVTGGHESLGAAGHWLVAMLYSSQIFSDFAGYTFMAIGISKLLGYVLPQNFNAPYIATTFQSFWRRWHISLSLF